VTLNFLYLLLGIVLLVFPRSWLRWGGLKRRGRSRRDRPSAEKHRDRLPGDESLWLGEEFGKRRNWLDLCRGLVGGYAVVVMAVNVPPGVMPGAAGLAFPWVQGSVLALAVMAQTLRYETRLALFPPIFFLGGLVFALVGWKAALLAFVAVWALNVVLPSAAIFLVVHGFVVLILGVVMGDRTVDAVVAAALIIVPALLALLSKRRLMAQFGRKAKVLRR
jgi:hypothetical protein